MDTFIKTGTPKNHWIMRTIVVFIIILFLGSPGAAQTTIITNISELSNEYTHERSQNNFMRDAKFEGSPFLNDQFIPGEIVANDTLLFRDVPLRYNIYTDRFEFLNEDEQVLEIGIMDNSFRYRLLNQHFLTLNYSDRGKETRGLLELLVDGNVRLYKQYIVHFKEATAPAGYQEAQPNRFIRQKEEYLLALANEMPETIKNPKDLVERLKAIDPGIEKYRKDQELNLRSEQDLIRIIQYCNKE